MRSRGWRFVRHLLWMPILALESLSAAAQYTQMPESPPPPTALISFHIPAQPLTAALVEFAVESGSSLGHATIPRAIQSRSVIGFYRPGDALTLLLEGTGYTYQKRDALTFRIIRSVENAPAKNKIAAINDIVVTATKRNASIQSLPYSIAVASGDMLQNLGITDTGGVALRIAGATVTHLGAGRDKVLIRGLSDGAFSSRTQSTVGIYMDDARLTFSAPDPHLMLVDIDRVEILRGPQGTLYGAGSIGGIFRIVTNKPSFDGISASLSTSGSLTRNGGANGGFEAMVNYPIISNKLALRAVGYLKKYSGYIDDTRLGLKNVNDTEIGGGRLAMRLKLNDAWSLTGGATYQRISDDDTQYVQADLKPLKRRNFLREPHRDDFSRFFLDVHGAFSWGKFVSSTSYIIRDIHDTFDASLAVPEIAGLPVSASPFKESRDIKTIVHESRLVSDGGGRLHWLAGFFLSRRDENFHSRLTVPGAGAVLVTAPGTPDAVLTEIRKNKVNESAVFGEVTLDLTHRVSFTAGIRGFKTTFGVTSTTDGPANGGKTLVKGSNDDKGVTPKFVLSYKINDDHLIYVQAAEGYRVGGVNINSPVSAAFESELKPGETFTAFDSDNLWTFEGGAKTQWLDGRLVVNGAGSYTIWNDIQTDQILPNGLFFIANAGDARIIATELDLYYQPTQYLNLQANVFWNKSELFRANPVVGGLSDAQLPAIPNFQIGLSGSYQHPVSGNINFFVSADYAFIGQSDLSFGKGLFSVMGDYHMTNARLGFASGSWSATLFVKNVGNTKANTFAFGNPFSLGKVRQSTPAQPRTIGLTLKWKY